MSREAGGEYELRLIARHRRGKLFYGLCACSAWIGILVLVVLLGGVLWKSSGRLSWSFLTSFDSSYPEKAGILGGLWGSLWLIVLTGLFSVPVGVGAAIYLEEYARDNWLRRLIQTNLANLAGVPSVVYGILGLTVFVRMFGLPQQYFGGGAKEVALSLGFAELHVPLPFGRSVISGALTLSLLVLPVVIVASQEALRAVPKSLRQASLALGATQWQTIRHQVLPPAIPGVMTGVILTISRAIGETAPLVLVGAYAFLPATPGRIGSPLDLATHPQGILDAPFDKFTALPIQIYTWVSFPGAEFHELAAAGIVVLLGVLLFLNLVAILIRQRYQRYTR